MGSCKWGQPPFMVPVFLPYAQSLAFSSLFKERYGGENWTDNIVKRFGLEQTLRRVGRPKARNSG